MNRPNYETEEMSEKVFSRVGPLLFNEMAVIQAKKYKDRSVQLRKYIIAGVEADKKELNINQ